MSLSVRHLRGRKGQALAEFALILPVVFLLIAGIIEFGRAWNIKQAVTDAAREGARYTVVVDTTSETGIKNRIKARLAAGQHCGHRSADPYHHHADRLAALRGRRGRRGGHDGEHHHDVSDGLGRGHSQVDRRQQHHHDLLESHHAERVLTPMRKLRPWLMLMLALGSGGLAAYLALRYLREQATPLMASEPRKTSIILAARSLPIGAVITEQDVKVVGWPGEAVPAGYIGSLKDAIGRGVITPVSENEPLLASKVSTFDQGGGLPIIIKDGMRAMSVRVDEVIGVAGFVLPGTHVDVLLTLDKGDNRPQTLTRTILQNVTVLAAGQQVQRDKEGKPQTVTVITLLIDARRCRAAGARGQGRPHPARAPEHARHAGRGLLGRQGRSAGPRRRAARAAASRRPTGSLPRLPRVNNTVIEGYRGASAP